MNIGVTDLSIFANNTVENIVGSITWKDVKTLLIFVNTVQLIAYFVLQDLYCVLFQI